MDSKIKSWTTLKVQRLFRLDALPERVPPFRQGSGNVLSFRALDHESKAPRDIERFRGAAPPSTGQPAAEPPTVRPPIRTVG